MSSQSFFDSVGLASLVSAGNISQSLREFTTAGMLFDYDDVLNFMRLVFVKPDVSETIQVNYEEIKTLGRTIPQFGYINTSGRTIDLEIHFVADVLPALQVHRKINWLKTFAYPRDTAQAIKPPKKMVVCMGMYLMIKGVVKRITIDHKGPFGGLATEAGFLSVLPQYAVAKVQISETENFWTGGQQTYEQAVLEMNYGLAGSGLPSYVGSALNLL